MVQRPRRPGATTRLAVVIGLFVQLLSARGSAAVPPGGGPAGTVHFERLPVPTIIVFSFHQDKRGFIWFASDSGLIRWDGYSARRFYPTIGPNRIGSLYTTTIGEDPDGSGLWLSTDNGLFRLDTRTNQWTFFGRRPGQTSGLGTTGIKALYVARSGIVWVGTDGLDRLDPRTGRVTHFRSDPNDPTTLGDPVVNKILEDDAGTLWLGSNSGLDRFDPVTGRTVRYDPAPAVGLGPRRLLVTTLAREAQGRIWVGTSLGALLFDPRTGGFSPVRGPAGDIVAALRGDIRAIASTADGRTWFGTVDGVVSFDPATGETRRYLGAPEGPNHVGATPIRALFVDRSGALWAAPQGQAVCRYDPGGTQVRLIRNDPQTTDGLAGAVWALAEDNDGIIWAGTDGGVDRIDPAAPAPRHHPSVPGDPTRLQSPLIRDITIDEHGTVWTGSYSGGAARLDPRTGRVRSYLPDPSQPDGIDQRHVRAVYRTQAGVWIGTVDGHLHRYDPASDRVVRVDIPGFPKGPGILAITGSPDGTLWLGTAGHGLIRFHPTLGTHAYASDPYDPATLSSITIWTVAVDHEGIVWAGTTAGLDALDPRSGRIRHYTLAEGLSGLSVKSIVEAADGALWVATDRGLSRLAQDRRTFRTFTVDDGFVTTAFNVKAGLRTRGGLLCFGGPSGLIIFDPTRLVSNPTPPPVVFTDLRLGTQVATVGADGSPLSHDIDATDTLTLEPRHYAFTLEFAALNYRFPGRNRYRYRLDGVDRDWVDADSSQRFATYTALAPGEYTFHVSGSNNDGVWSPTPRRLRIVIVPPWWRTTLALAVYWLGAIGSVFGLVWLRTLGHRRELARQRIVNEDLERRVAERTTQLEQANTSLAAANKELEAFSYSVSHDLRAPLRAIDGFARVLATEHSASLPAEGLRLLGIVRDSATQMSHLIDDLLAFSRLGRQPLSRHLVDMRALASQVVAELMPESAGRRPEIVMADLPACAGDRNLLHQVWSNLVGNALKFTRNTEQPRVEIGWDPTERGGAYFVRDNGAGFDMAYVDKLFGVFQRLHRAAEFEGTGVGLAIVQRIVHRHGGQAWARGAVGEGATFWFTVGASDAGAAGLQPSAHGLPPAT